MAEWKKFTGSDEQVAEMDNAEYGWIVRFQNGGESSILTDTPHRYRIGNATEYLICDPHPHAAMINRWVETRQPVYRFDDYDNEWQLIEDPKWNPDLRYSFGPPQEKEFIEVRDYLYEAHTGDFRKRTAHRKFSDIEKVESAEGFVRWLDDDWRRIYV